MPTYSYACTACEHQFDTVQKFTDPSLTDCPQCSGRLRKLFSSVGIVFKGSGSDHRSTQRRLDWFAQPQWPRVQRTRAGVFSPVQRAVLSNQRKQHPAATAYQPVEELGRARLGAHRPVGADRARPIKR